MDCFGFGWGRADSSAVAVRADYQPEPGIAVRPDLEVDFQMIATGYRHPRILTDCALHVGRLAPHVAERLKDKTASLAGERSFAFRFGIGQSSASSSSFEQDSSPLIAKLSPNMATASKTGEGFIDANTAFQVRVFIFL